MEKKPIHYADAFARTMQLLGGPGCLLNSLSASGKPNTMTIGWASFGITWGRPTAIVLVRPSRHTYQLLEETPDFTINVLPEAFSETLTYCGTVTGRTHDKFSDRQLTLVPAQCVQTPVIEQAIICYECRSVHRNDVVPSALSPEIHARCYPHGDFHRVYFGEILACYGED